MQPERGPKICDSVRFLQCFFPLTEISRVESWHRDGTQIHLPRHDVSRRRLLDLTGGVRVDAVAAAAAADDGGGAGVAVAAAVPGLAAAAAGRGGVKVLQAVAARRRDRFQAAWNNNKCFFFSKAKL